jgi:hypothetical protein
MSVGDLPDIATTLAKSHLEAGESVYITGGGARFASPANRVYFLAR